MQSQFFFQLYRTEVVHKGTEAQLVIAKTLRNVSQKKMMQLFDELYDFSRNHYFGTKCTQS